MTGIYKITTPYGFIYIGQSRNIDQRWQRYKTKRGHSRIGMSFNLYPVEYHKFEVLHELPFDVSNDILNNYEEFYISSYKEAGFTLLNYGPGGYNWGEYTPTKKEVKRVFSDGHRAAVRAAVIKSNKARAGIKRVFRERKPMVRYGFDNKKSVVVLHSEYGIFCTQREAAFMLGISEQWLGQAMKANKTTKFIYA